MQCMSHHVTGQKDKDQHLYRCPTSESRRCQSYPGGRIWQRPRVRSQDVENFYLGLGPKSKSQRFFCALRLHPGFHIAQQIQQFGSGANTSTHAIFERELVGARFKKRRLSVDLSNVQIKIGFFGSTSLNLTKFQPDSFQFTKSIKIRNLLLFLTSAQADTMIMLGITNTKRKWQQRANTWNKVVKFCVW